MPERLTPPVALPPVPDTTGHPRPPTAPRIVGAWTGNRVVAAEHHRAEDHRTLLFTGASSLTEPERQLRHDHPLLEEAIGAPPTRARRLTTATLTGIAVLAQLVVIGGGYLLIAGDADAVARNRTTLGYLLAAAFLLAFTAGLFTGRPRRIRAGAHTINTGGANDLWLYQLDTISIRHPRYRRHGPELRLEGKFAAKTWPMSMPLGLLETNQELWDLVYNGIRHSTANGAQVDQPTRQMLRLPLEPPSSPAATPTNEPR